MLRRWRWERDAYDENRNAIEFGSFNPKAI